MPSPFPGMNPCLEHADVWQDFHQSFIPLIRQMLSEQVRPKYLMKLDVYRGSWTLNATPSCADLIRPSRRA